jgi:hypothetical protein
MHLVHHVSRVGHVNAGVALPFQHGAQQHADCSFVVNNQNAARIHECKSLRHLNFSLNPRRRIARGGVVLLSLVTIGGATVTVIVHQSYVCRRIDVPALGSASSKLHPR